MSRYKPYAEYKDSGVEWIGKMPAHWDVKRLRHVATFKNSNVDKKAYDDQNAVKLCNYTDVYNNEFIVTDLPFMLATATASEVEQFSLKKGDVMITKDSEDPSDIGIPAFVAEDLPGVVCGYHLTMIRGTDFDTARLLHRILQCHPTKAHFFVEAPGITRYGLSHDAIGDLRLCLPPEGERGPIVNYVDRETARIDALIAKKSEFIELLKKKRQALITHAVTEGLNPNVKMKDSGVEWIGDVPKHWITGRVRDFCRDISTGPFGTSLGANDYVENGIPVINPSHLVNGRCVPDPKVSVNMATAQRLKYWALNDGDVVTARRGELGRSAVIGNEEAGWICGTGSLRLAAEPDRITADYIYYLLQSSYARAWLTQESVGSTMQNLSEKLIGRLPVVKPPTINEQISLVAVLQSQLERLDALMSKTNLSIDLLRKRRSALITAAVTGEIDLRESV